jgi:hypothetical protein
MSGRDGQREYELAVVDAAMATLGVREVRGNNRGPDVEAWLRGVRAHPGSPWCMAWVYAVHERAAAWLGGRTTCPRTGGAAKAWIAAGERGLVRWTAAEVVPPWSRVRPGDVAVFSRSARPEDAPRIRQGERRAGHVGIVLATYWHPGGPLAMHTAEGNVDPPEAGRDGVFHRLRMASDPRFVGVFRPSLVLP